MSSPQLHRRLIGRLRIRRRVRELAHQIAQDYRDLHPVLVGTLKGSFVFLADLVRELPIAVEIDFVGAASYGPRTSSAGEVELYCSPRLSLQGRHIIVVEDIIDTGITLAQVLERLWELGPASIKVCALLRKRKAGQLQVEAHYLGFEIPDRFVVGYGLDCKEQFRHLPDVWTVRGV